MKLNLKQIKCKRCGWEWTPRGSIVSVCPNCNSYKFDQEMTPKEVARKERHMSRRNTAVFKEI